MFSRQEFHTLDDSEFIPLLEVVMDEFASSALAPEEVDGLWDHAYKTYDRLCREADPSYSFEENRDLMRSFLIGSRGMNKDKR